MIETIHDNLHRITIKIIPYRMHPILANYVNAKGICTIIWHDIETPTSRNSATPNTLNRMG